MAEDATQEYSWNSLKSNAVFSLLLCTLLIVYFTTERSVLHFSRNLRRLYFLVLVALLSYWALSAVQNASSSRIELLMVLVIVVASVIEDRLDRAYLTPFCSSALDDVRGTPEAVGKAELLSSIVRQTNKWQGFSVGLAKQLAWLDGSLHKHRAAVHEVLCNADKAELNFMIAHNNCANLLEVAAEKTIDYMTSKDGRLGDLTVLSRSAQSGNGDFALPAVRAALIDGFQKLGMRHRLVRQSYAARILLDTKAADLTSLKSLLDDGPDYHTAFKLLYNDFQGDLQVQLLKHVSAEGQRALAQFQQQHSQIPGMTLKVVSDIDDTLMCSGGHFPAGSDLRYPSNCVYPGVLAFYRSLAEAAFAQRAVSPSGEEEANVSLSDAIRSSLQTPASRPMSMERVSPSRDRAGLPSYRTYSQPRGAPGAAAAVVRWPVGGGEAWCCAEADGSRARGGGGAPGLPTDSRSEEADRIWQREGEPSGGLDSIAESSVHEDEEGALGESPGSQPREEEPASQRGAARAASPTVAVPARGPPPGSAPGSFLGQDLGAAMAAEMPSAGSLQNMVGLTVLARAPSATSPLAAARPRAQCTFSGTRSSSLSDGRQPASGHLVFLSARPESYKGFTEGLSFKKIFEPLVRRGDLQGYPVLLLGSFRVGPTALYAYAADRRGSVGAASMQFYQKLAAKKLERFKQFAAIYPECCWVFVGDNGQGDVLLAEQLTQLLGRRILACFIHQVVPLAETVTGHREGALTASEQDAASWRQKWRGQNIFFGQDYVSLAVEAFKLKCMDANGLQCVAGEACQDLRHVSARFAHSSFSQQLAARQLNAGIAAANKVLPAHLLVDPLPDLTARKPKLAPSP